MRTFTPTRKWWLVLGAVVALSSALLGGSSGALAAKRIGMDEFMTGLACVESKGSFTATNRRSGAIGKYQIMPRNWPAWSARYLRNRWAKPTPRNQEFVARERVSDLYELHGSWRRVAKWWRTGNAEANESLWSDASRRYVERVIRWATWSATPRLQHLVPEGCFPARVSAPRIRTQPWPRVTVSGGRVHIRRAAGYEHRSFDTVRRGTRLTVLGRDADARGKPWLKVGLRDGQVGWIAAWFAKQQRPAD